MTKYILEKLNPDFGYFYKAGKSLVCTKTKYQNMELIETAEFGRVLLLDNVTQVASKNDYLYHEPMVHPALCSHPKPTDVLIIGAGDGGILREVLKHKTVRSVVMAELDEGVIEFSKKYMPEINCGAFGDKRVELVIGDGRRYVETTKKRFDVVIMDMTDPFGPSIMLYTKEFFQAVKRTFKDKNGVFVMHTESPISRPRTFNAIVKTLGSVFKNVNSFYLYIQMYAVLWSIGVCSDAVNTSKIDAKKISGVLKNRKVGRLFAYSGSTHESMQAEFPFIKDIKDTAVSIITDKKHVFADKIDCNLDMDLEIVERKR